MSKILSAIDLKNGEQASPITKTSLLTRPLQVLPREKKDEEWTKRNMDWLEWNGLIQVRSQAKRMISNYKTAYGVIEKNDYVVSENNEYASLLTAIAEEDELAAEIKNYPLVQIVINTLTSEFAKRNTDVSYYAIDSDSVNEILQNKANDIERVLIEDANNKLKMKLMEYKGDTESEEYKQLASMVNNPEVLKKLPEIEDFYRTNYRTIYEQWAQHQHNIDVERFRMYELENSAFLDLLSTNREFWHFRMLDDDYDIELWDTITTFYHRSPGTKYVSNCAYVGNIQLMTLQEVIDRYGRFIDESDLSRLESLLPTQNFNSLLTTRQNDGAFYNTAEPYQNNGVGYGSLDFTRHVAMFGYNSTPMLDMLLNGFEDNAFNKIPYLRVTTAYWISYRKLGLYTAIDSNGNKIEKIVTEDFKITTKPVFNKTLLNEESERTLIYGEYIEWIWMREVWGGIKIGPNSPTYFGMQSQGLDPIYIGINSKNIKPLPF